ncbi:MAG: DNA repair protein RadC [Candidatus Helarchaeota archaeon]|nr:DNA repair protein RadC [Candidatus Helarchaeota archaeon]
MRERYLKKVKELPKSLRPREKLKTSGAKKLSDVDLLAIMLAKGTKRENVIKIASRILHKYKIKELINLSLKDWNEISGIGETKAIQLIANFEMGRRIFEEVKEETPLINSTEKILKLLNGIRNARREHLIGIYLDGQNILLRQETLAIGRSNISYVHPKDIIQPAMIYDATSIIIAHNHPSGKLEPSEEDIKLTQKIKKATDFLDLYLIDHLIITKENYYSFRENSRI